LGQYFTPSATTRSLVSVRGGLTYKAAGHRLMEITVADGVMPRLAGVPKS